MSTFGSLIRALRQCDEVSQVELAERLEVSKQFLSAVERDQKFVSLGFVKRLSEALGYPPDIFLKHLLNADLERVGIACRVEIVPTKKTRSHSKKRSA